MTESKSTENSSEDSTGEQFMRLYVANERRISGFILTLVHDWTATEDIMQETAKVMWTKFKDFEPGTDFVAWALCIARYQVMNYRKSQKTKMIFSNQVIEELSKQAENYAKENSRRHESLKKCLQKLNERDRQLIELRYEIGATVKSVAQRVGRGVNAVYQSLNRIHFQLLHCIQRALAMEDRE